MLAAFISGITAGSLVAGRVMARSRRLLFFFGISELAIALIILFTMPFYERMPYYFWRVRYLLNPVPDTFFLYNLAKFTLCFMTMFLPTLFFGMTLPFVSHIASDRMNELARKIGSVFAANTVGTLLGALTAGLALIPYFGLFRSLEITVAINFALGLALLLRTPDIPSPRWRRGALAVSLGAALFYWVALPHGDASRFALGVFRNRTAPPTSFSEFTASSFFNFELAYYKEDLSGNVAVLKQVNEQNQPRLSLTVNGKADASSDSDAPTQTLLAQLPLLMKNGSSAVLLIGMGSGMTAGSALTHPLERLDCVEISTGVAEAARLFGPYNNNVYENPRFHLIVEDARTFVNITDRRYDVIISEPSNPWMAGVGNLFTIEFFRDAARIMPDDGVMAQWFHLYEVSDEIVGTAVRTFQTVFPYTYIFQGNSTDIIMLGSRRPFEPDFDRLKEKMAAPEIRDDLAKIRIHDLSGLLGLQMISPEHIPGIAALGDINSDYIPLIEYRAPAAFYQGARAQKITEADERYTIGDRLLLHRYMEKDTLTVENLRHLIALFDARPTDVEALAFPLMARYLALQPQDAGIGRRFAEISLTRKNYGGTLDLYRPLLEGGDAALFERYADLLYDQERPYHSVFTPGSFDEAMTALREGQARFPDVETFLIRLGRASLASGRYEQAFEYFQQAQQRRGSETTPDDELPTLLGRAAYHLRRYEQAKQYIDAALKINPRNVIALQYYLLIDQAVKLTMK
jgi:spermidine synthase/tetratricopeptide (TPR) repeat protein